MVIIETSIFTKTVKELISDDDYRGLQHALVLRPDVGKLIPGGGGLRKIRWNIPGKGKRSGFRVIYFWDKPNETIFMLLIYKKTKLDDLTKSQLKILRNLVKEWLQ
ncbi:type II toxin-antitoxin system RelE/ParE family toxin [candidate division CSSED10-310 bacterium]|uniref:Type II toxin-antitoxin system RelE/ParE family toxin n=1 Tax=candidate division CSSED10-310 bacterium TaxID=2855610 RepID=A0ABV6Z601_UNCC1